MIDAKDYLAPKRFHIVSYVCAIVHFLCGSAFTVVTAVLRDGEKAKFSCSVDGKASTTHRIWVDRACFLRYDQTFNSPLPLYGFVLLSTGSAVLISVIYSLVVWKRVDEIESYHERRTGGEVEDQTQNTKTVYVFYSYFIHLVLRALFGIIFTVLQHEYFYRNGFDSEFSCNLPPTDQVTTGDINTQKGGSRNSSSFTCENATASEKSSWGIIVSVLNSVVAFVMFLELIYLLRRFSILNRYSEYGWNDDSKFVTVYLLGKQYNLPERQSLNSNGNHFQEYIQWTSSLLENNTSDGTEDRIDSPSCRNTRLGWLTKITLLCFYIILCNWAPSWLTPQITLAVYSQAVVSIYHCIARLTAYCK